LTKEEVEKMKREAQEHSTEDRKRREDIDLKNQADNLTFQTDKQLKEFGERLTPETKGKVESANEKLKEAVKGGNAGAIKSAMEVLNNAWNEASTQMYQAATAEGQSPKAGPQPDAGTGAADEKKVEDAQYEVVDDKNKK
jgi:molecular chaperone DnaK